VQILQLAHSEIYIVLCGRWKVQNSAAVNFFRKHLFRIILVCIRNQVSIQLSLSELDLQMDADEMLLSVANLGKDLVAVWRRTIEGLGRFVFSNMQSISVASDKPGTAYFTEEGPRI